jgi:hypothetical protein
VSLNQGELIDLANSLRETLNQHRAVTDAAIAWYEADGTDEAVDEAWAFLRETVEAFLAWRDEPDCGEVRR